LIQALALTACSAVLCTAVWIDFQTYRIPNKIILIGMCLAGICALLPTSIGLIDSAMGWFVGLAIFLPLYMLGILGAGDVKLLAMVGMFVGYPAVLIVALYTCLAGGVLAIFFAIRYRKLREMSNNLYQGMLIFCLQISSRNRFTNVEMKTLQLRLPYALAIFIGTMSYALLHTVIFYE